MLQVAVEHGAAPSPRGAQPGHDRTGQPALGLVAVDDHQLRAEGGRLGPRDRRGVVGGVVDHHDLGAGPPTASSMRRSSSAMLAASS